MHTMTCFTVGIAGVVSSSRRNASRTVGWSSVRLSVNQSIGVNLIAELLEG